MLGFCGSVKVKNGEIRTSGAVVRQSRSCACIRSQALSSGDQQSDQASSSDLKTTDKMADLHDPAPGTGAMPTCVSQNLTRALFQDSAKRLQSRVWSRKLRLPHATRIL